MNDDSMSALMQVLVNERASELLEKAIARIPQEELLKVMERALHGALAHFEGRKLFDMLLRNERGDAVRVFVTKQLQEQFSSPEVKKLVHDTLVEALKNPGRKVDVTFHVDRY